MKSKKGQLKIQQMTFMLLAVTLFFVLVLLFFLAIRVNNLEQSAEEIGQDKVSALVQKIASNPEFTFEGIPNAIDADKLMILQGENQYKDFFGVEGIIIQKLYPISEEIECTRTNYPNCNKIKIFTDKDSFPTSNYVSWCTKQTINGNAYDRCELALLMIE